MQISRIPSTPLWPDRGSVALALDRHLIFMSKWSLKSFNLPWSLPWSRWLISLHIQPLHTTQLTPYVDVYYSINEKCTRSGFTVCGDQALAEMCKIERNLDDPEVSCPGITTSSAQWKGSPWNRHMFENLPACLWIRTEGWCRTSVLICNCANFYLCQIGLDCFHLQCQFVGARNRGRKRARQQHFHNLKVLRESELTLNSQGLTHSRRY